MNAPTSTAVSACWEKFSRDILAPSLEGSPAVAMSLAQASFYFGGLAMLELVESVLTDAPTVDAAEQALDAYRAEILAHVEQRAAEVH